jgi:hypothetical protein
MWGGVKEEPWLCLQPEPWCVIDAPSAGYPLSGCVPAEPDAVSPVILEFSEPGGKR